MERIQILNVCVLVLGDRLVFLQFETPFRRSRAAADRYRRQQGKVTLLTVVVDVARSARHANDGARKVMGYLSQPYIYHVSQLVVKVRATLRVLPRIAPCRDFGASTPTATLI